MLWNLPWNQSWKLSCWKKYLKNHDLPEFSSDSPLEGGPDANSGRPCTLIHSPPCRTPCRLFIHGLSFEPLGLHLLVWSELRWSPPFRPMRALTLPWSRAFSLVCEVALIYQQSTLFWIFIKMIAKHVCVLFIAVGVCMNMHYFEYCTPMMLLHWGHTFSNMNNLEQRWPKV